jgi:hypothetical protein
MILCMTHNQWYLASGSAQPQWADHLSIEVAPQMPRRDDLQWHDQGRKLYAIISRDQLAEFIFYPSLSYQGCPVHVLHGWEPNQNEPIVSVLMPVPRAGPEESSAEVARRRQRLVADGWTDGGGEGLAGLVRVADTDFAKIPGPLPPA